MYLRRHLGGDWGDLSEGDRELNDAALASGQDRLFSSYQVAPDLKLWIITDWHRSVTTLLQPSEFLTPLRRSPTDTYLFSPAPCHAPLGEVRATFFLYFHINSTTLTAAFPNNHHPPQ